MSTKRKRKFVFLTAQEFSQRFRENPDAVLSTEEFSALLRQNPDVVFSAEEFSTLFRQNPENERLYQESLKKFDLAEGRSMTVDVETSSILGDAEGHNTEV